MLARLVKAFNYRHQPRRHAADLVSALHVVLRMLHHLNSSGEFLSSTIQQGSLSMYESQASFDHEVVESDCK